MNGTPQATRSQSVAERQSLSCSVFLILSLENRSAKQDSETPGGNGGIGHGSLSKNGLGFQLQVQLGVPNVILKAYRDKLIGGIRRLARSL